jgi:hypothetical protein
MYFGVLKWLGWVEATGHREASSVQDNYPPAPERTYYRLTQKGIDARYKLWSNPLFTFYPEIVPSHMKKSEKPWFWYSSFYFLIRHLSMTEIFRHLLELTQTHAVKISMSGP